MSGAQVFKNKTGTGASNPVSLYGRVVTAILHLTYGTTITVDLEGSYDQSTWNQVATGTFTTGSPKILTKPAVEWYPYYRLNITANTGVTVNKAFIGGDE